jgi:hypothetical protein
MSVTPVFALSLPWIAPQWPLPAVRCDEVAPKHRMSGAKNDSPVAFGACRCELHTSHVRSTEQTDALHDLATL